MPIYVYRCPKCSEKTEDLREIENVYDDVICNNCATVYDGKKNKLVESGITVTYEQGSIKGKM